MQIMKFKDMNELIERANKTIYGLAASVFTKDIDKMNTVVSGVRAGTVWWVNNLVNKLRSVLHASVPLLVMNFVVTLLKYLTIHEAVAECIRWLFLTMFWRKSLSITGQVREKTDFVLFFYNNNIE